MRRHHALGGVAVLGVLVVLSLIAVGVARHPGSIEGAGSGLLMMDVALLMAYGVAGTWAWRQRRPEVAVALSAGAQVGVMLGAVHIANHVIESFVPIRGRMAHLVLGAGPVLLMLALFGAAGSAAWARTRSAVLAVTAGVWSALVAALIALGFAFSLNLAFEARAESRLQEAFAASGMSDPGAFLVKNSLEAASEALVRMPALALFLSCIGCFVNAWITGRARSMALAVAWLTPVMFVTGTAALWHASSLERAARPPFVVAGVLLAGVALSGAHPIWSVLRRTARQ